MKNEIKYNNILIGYLKEVEEGLNHYPRKVKNLVYVDIEIKEVEKKKTNTDLKEIDKYKTLSICGYSKNIGGQILDILKSKDFEPTTNFNVEEFYKIWDEWHLNDLHPGSRRQEDALKLAKIDNWANNYNKACDYLKSINLYNDDGYIFGSSCLVEDLPLSVIKQIIEGVNRNI